MRITKDKLREALNGERCPMHGGLFTCLDAQAEARRRPHTYGGGGEFAGRVAAGEDLCLVCRLRALVAA